MGDFAKVLVKDIAEKIQYGYTGKSVENGKYRYLRITDIQNNKVDWESVPFSDIEVEEQVEKYRLKPNDIVFARTGATVGKSFLIDEVENSVFASYLIRIVPKEVVYPKYLQYFFQSEDYWAQIRGQEVGAAQPNVNGKKLGKLEVPLPPLPEQRRIVSKLDALFAEIDASLALIDQNIEQAEALKLSVLDEEINRYTTKSKTVKEIQKKMTSGFACSKKHQVEDGYVHLRTHNIDTSGKLNFDLMIQIDPSKVDAKKNKILRGDILFNNTNSKELVGKTALVDQDYDYGFSNHITRIRLDEKQVIPEYFVIIMMSLHSKGLFQRICKKWIGQAGINLKMLNGIEIKFPSIENQQKIVQKLDALFEEIDGLVNDYKQKRESLEALKSSLLDRAFKGEL